MAKFDWQRYVFEDVTGQLREIRSCPYLSLDKLKDYLDLLMQTLTELGGVDFKHSYCQSDRVRLLTDAVLEMCGVSPDWVSIAMVERLVHHQQDEDGNFKPGILIELNFPNRTEIAGKPMEFKEWIANGVASLLSIEGSKSLEEAIALASKVPHDFLEAVLLARCYQLNPKSKIMEELDELNSNPEKLDNQVLNFASMQWKDIDVEKLL